STTQHYDEGWHNITEVLSCSGTSDTVKVYTDGELNAFQTVNGNSLLNNAPLVIGKKAGDGNSNPDFQLNNLQIYNAAFTANEVANLAGITHIDDTHPKKSNLIGY